MSKKLKVLLVEDQQDDADLVLRALVRGGYSPDWERVQTSQEMRTALTRGPWDLILSDYSMPTFSAPEAFALAKAEGVDAPFIIVSGTVGEEVAVAAMRTGVHDYLIKGALARLAPAIDRELRDAAQRRERKKIEQQLALSEQMLRQSQKMEAIGRLAAGIAHDFNNQLAVILTYCELFLQELGPAERGRTNLEEIKAASLRSADLTRQLLAFSRQQVLTPRVVDLNEIVLSLDRMLRRVLGKDVELTTVPNEEPGRVKVDPGQIEQVLMNLVVNARDAMPEGGQLTIEISNVVIDDEYAALHPEVAPGPHVRLRVMDTGTGMAQDVQAKVFEPFFTTKEKGKGTGLGLATAFGTVRQSGGTITVQSEVGRGTTFAVYLPVTEEKPARSSSSIPAATLHGKETVLLVEADPSVRRAVASILREYGYTVLEAETAGHAMALCGTNESIDLLVADVVGPGIGAELARRVGTTRPNVRVLYMSGQTDSAALGPESDDEAVQYIQKPFTPYAFARKVREVLSLTRVA